MKTILTIVVAALTLSAPALAVQKYNPFGNRWETTSSDSELRYNPYEGTWSYEEKGSAIEYNPFENRWEYAPPPSGQRQGQGVYGPFYDPSGHDRKKGW